MRRKNMQPIGSRGRTILLEEATSEEFGVCDAIIINKVTQYNCSILTIYIRERRYWRHSVIFLSMFNKFWTASFADFEQIIARWEKMYIYLWKYLSEEEILYSTALYHGDLHGWTFILYKHYFTLSMLFCYFQINSTSSLMKASSY